MTRAIIRLAGRGLAVLGLAALLLAPAANPAPAADPATRFAERAAHGNLREIALGELAAEKGESARVRNFGDKMATEHAKAQDNLAEAAEAMGIALPDQLGERGAALKRELSALSGTAFDEAYMQAMVEAHEYDVRLYQEFGQDPDTPLEEYAFQTSRVLLAHHELAKQVRDETS